MRRIDPKDIVITVWLGPGICSVPVILTTPLTTVNSITRRELSIFYIEPAVFPVVVVV